MTFQKGQTYYLSLNVAEEKKEIIDQSAQL